MLTTKENRRSRRVASAKAESKRIRRAEFSDGRARRTEFVDDRTAIAEQIEAMHDAMHRGEILFVTVGCAPLAGEKRSITPMPWDEDDRPQEPPQDSPDWDEDEPVSLPHEYL